MSQFEILKDRFKLATLKSVSFKIKWFLLYLVMWWCRKHLFFSRKIAMGNFLNPKEKILITLKVNYYLGPRSSSDLAPVRQLH